VAGLLHDLGKVVLALNLPDDLALIQEQTKSGRLFFYEAEAAVLSFNHGEVGQWLAEHWNLPDSLAEPMRLHHHPERAVTHPDVTAIVHIADSIIRGWGFGYAGDALVPPISQAAWDRLGLKTGDLKTVLDLLEPRLTHLSELSSFSEA
jgi:HD-like signal output (HDOD) protein